MTAIGETQTLVGIVPGLVGLSLMPALAHGFQPAMIAMAGLCLAGGLITGCFVSDERLAGARRAPHPQTHGCALPVSDPATPS
jgi:hypothetical protein